MFPKFYVGLGLGLLAVIATITFLPSAAGQSSSKAGYREPCNETVRCNSAAFLTCQLEQCDCMTSESMVYNATTGKCLVLANEKCFVTVSITTTTGEQVNLYGDYQELPCIVNADCESGSDSDSDQAQAGVCICNADSYEDPDSDGYCILKGDFDEPCTTDSECSQTRFLKCLGGTCQCDDVHAFKIPAADLDPDTPSLYKSGQHDYYCVGRAAKSCLNGACTPNAYCDQGYHAAGIAGTCHCRNAEAYYKGYCGKQYGLRCTKSTDKCINNFVCIDGTCRCKYPLHQLYYNGECKSLVRGPCGRIEVEVEDGDIASHGHGHGHVLNCVDNAVCTTKSHVHNGRPFTRSRCDCKIGFIENLAGRCHPVAAAYGQPCAQSQATPKCDQSVPLFCRDGRCGCHDELQVFDLSAQKCVGQVDAYCTGSGDCIVNAVCKKSLAQTAGGLGPGRGFCFCPESSLTTNGTCDSAGSSGSGHDKGLLDESSTAETTEKIMQ